MARFVIDWRASTEGQRPFGGSELYDLRGTSLCTRKFYKCVDLAAKSTQFGLNARKASAINKNTNIISNSESSKASQNIDAKK